MDARVLLHSSQRLTGLPVCSGWAYSTGFLYGHGGHVNNIKNNGRHVNNVKNKCYSVMAIRHGFSQIVLVPDTTMIAPLLFSIDTLGVTNILSRT